MELRGNGVWKQSLLWGTGHCPSMLQSAKLKAASCRVCKQRHVAAMGYSSTIFLKCLMTSACQCINKCVCLNLSVQGHLLTVLDLVCISHPSLVLQAQQQVQVLALLLALTLLLFAVLPVCSAGKKGDVCCSGNARAKRTRTCTHTLMHNCTWVQLRFSTTSFSRDTMIKLKPECGRTQVVAGPLGLHSHCALGCRCRSPSPQPPPAHQVGTLRAHKPQERTHSLRRHHSN